VVITRNGGRREFQEGKKRVSFRINSHSFELPPGRGSDRQEPSLAKKVRRKSLLAELQSGEVKQKLIWKGT